MVRILWSLRLVGGTVKRGSRVITIRICDYITFEYRPLLRLPPQVVPGTQEWQRGKKRIDILSVFSLGGVVVRTGVVEQYCLDETLIYGICRWVHGMILVG